MFGLRQKLLLGFGGLLVILLIVSGLGIAVLSRYRGALDQFYFENWRSVEYGQNMIDALQHLKDTADPISGATAEPTAAALASAQKSAEPWIKTFDDNCDSEDHNITLNGEREIAEALTLSWSGKDLSGQKKTAGYRDEYSALLSDQTTGAARSAAFAEITRLAPQVKQHAQDVIKLNFDNMHPFSDRVKAMAADATRLMILLSVFGIGLAVLLTIIVGRGILQPLTMLTQSFREIEAGNLDLVVQVKSRDELRQLAEAFNSMAAKLREFRRTDRAKLVRTQRTTQLAVSSLPDAVAIVNPDGVIELSNQRAQQLFRLLPEKPISASTDKRLVELYRQVSSDRKAFEPRGYESVIEVYDMQGTPRFFLPHAIPLVDSDNHLLGVTLVLADVTNLRKLDEMKSGLLSVVSHELKTPLTSIRMAAHLLLEERVGPLTPKQMELLTASQEDADRLHKIIENLLDMGRMESGRAPLDLKPAPAEKVISESVEPMHAAFRDHGIELTTEVAADTPMVQVDQTRISHVFGNLLGNALKFTPAGGHVRVAAAPAGGRFVKFTISDNGCGIPREYQQRVFERFFRAPGQSSEAGAGLGLAIARDIVEAHGGTISVDSVPGEGSTFTFLLLSAEPSLPQVQSARHQGEPSKEIEVVTT